MTHEAIFNNWPRAKKSLKRSLPRLVRELSREVHTRGQTKGICVEHRVVRVEEVVHGAEYGTTTIRVGGLEGRGGRERRVLSRIRHRRLHRLRLRLHLQRRRERLRERAGTS